MLTAVEVMKRFAVHSIWTIKQKQHLFGMKPLYAVLKVKFKDRPAGHWVVFLTKIVGVPFIAMAYIWSQKCESSMLSTCGSTEPIVW